MHNVAIALPADFPLAVEGRAAAQLRIEAGKARSFGKHFVAAVLESLARVLPQAPLLLNAMESWPGDLASAGVIFRLNAGVHAMARSGRHPGLQAVYAAARADSAPEALLLDITLSLALHDAEADLLRWMNGPTQTNEVARVAGLAAVLLELNARAPMPTALLELGTSAGINLNLDRYDIHIGTTQCGDSASEVHIAPRWEGVSPHQIPLGPLHAQGVDLSPLDVRREADAERLMSYIWPGEPERSNRLRAAIGIARQHPPHVEHGSASTWLSARLATPAAEGERRVVFHSMVAQYMPEAERRAVDDALAKAGAVATPSRPLVRVGLEWNDPRSAVEITVTQWNGCAGSGIPVLAARCHPYAEWFEWFGLHEAAWANSGMK